MCEVSKEERQALEYLKCRIEMKMHELETLQRKHRCLTGRDHVMPLYLTSPVNRAILEHNANRHPAKNAPVESCEPLADQFESDGCRTETAGPPPSTTFRE